MNYMTYVNPTNKLTRTPDIGFAHEGIQISSVDKSPNFPPEFLAWEVEKVVFLSFLTIVKESSGFHPQISGFARRELTYQWI